MRRRPQDGAVAAAAIFSVASVFWFASATDARAGAPLSVFPSAIQLDDVFARRQVLVSVAGSHGVEDRTTQAQYVIQDTQVATVDERGYVSPVKVGETALVVTLGNQKAEVPVSVTAINGGRPVHFGREVLPLLTRFGCNAGGCHGKASGQNGFKLSLFGFDADFDYKAIVQEARGRRVFPAAPDQSLLLLKASGGAPHGGGRRIAKGTDAYQVLRRWIEQGLPQDAKDAPTIKSVRIEPTERTMGKNEKQQLAVVAEYSDGSIRDVTRQAQFNTNEGAVAVSSDEGLVSTNDLPGEAAVMAAYLGQVAVFKVLVPTGEPLDAIPEFQPKNYIDELVLAKWKKLGLRPSPLCSDDEFLRRLTIDLAGRLPTIDEAVAFAADGSPNKRDAAVDRLLSSPDYPAYFAMRWGTILRNSRLAGADKAAYAFHNWLKDLIAQNRPYDELVRGVVAASGEWQDAPAINWYWQMRDDQLHQPVGDTAQVFLGLRLQCAQCHHHPYERWSQDDYYGLAGFFTRLGRKSFGEPPPYFSSRRVTTSVRHPLTGKPPEPKFLDGEIIHPAPDEDPRQILVDWMTQPENPFFARALVNRLWGHMLGRGLVEPVDDMRATNPPSNPELLDALAKDFIDHKFDMKRILRAIATSRVYQLSSTPTELNSQDRQNYARFYVRRLVAEVLHDAIDSACGAKTNFGGMPAGARAVDLPHEGFGSYFLDTFGRPHRVSGCECERPSGANLPQVLLMANSDEIEGKIATSKGRIEKLIEAKTGPMEAVSALYLAALSRQPTPEESSRAVEYVSSATDDKRRAALEDVLWTLLNSKEFVFNH